MTGTTTRRIEADGVGLQLEISGEGPPVLLLHGFTGSTESMSGIAANLRDQYRTISIDLVGHGRSDSPRDGALYTMSHCVHQLNTVIGALALSPVHVIGYSMGGRAALSLCAMHPESVASAILVGTSAGVEDATQRVDRVAQDETLAARIEAKGVPAFVDYWTALSLFASQKRLSDSASAKLREQRLRNCAHGLALSLRGMGTGAQPALYDQLPAIQTPICLVVGEEDAKFRAIANDLALRLPNAVVQVVRSAGHAAHVEQPDDFFRIARRHLAEAAFQPMARTEPARRSNS